VFVGVGDMGEFDDDFVGIAGCHGGRRPEGDNSCKAKTSSRQTKL